MRWLKAKLSVLLSSLFVVLGGAAMSQAAAFTNAYLQRLGGHIDEAKRQLESLRTGEIGRVVNEPVTREQLLEIFQRRVSDLEAAREVIADANLFVKPLICLVNLNIEIAWGTFSAFVPSLPLDPVGLLYGLVGAVAGWGVLALAKRWFRQGDGERDAKVV